ncbi:DUF2793 domain-containing protein [Chelativorans intermedius]|uniref:DUF2793 domain-containing protein n=1 Tax=Chelativorans intermedius TaxID=515947 RepID=A0ABV6D411_9HYPH|nr:DUF2793 domain-containing protein [Chelativorans intermedius]MCT8997078.1 DUF2793 domain-containing protein [Chelativorans intermedius]
MTTIDPENTARLKLPYIMPSQAQKHVTHNEALRMLDALVQPGVLDRDLTAPPADPQEGDHYIVAAGAAGAWAGKDHHLAAFMDGVWFTFPPRLGMLAWIADEARLVAWNGAAWLPPAPDDLQNLSLLGVGTGADAANPFSAKLNNTLWTARYGAEGGDGSLRYKLNKEAPGDTTSLLFQTDWSGRAEIGLAGSDDLSIKVSADGGTWSEALRIDRHDGVTAVQGLRHQPTGRDLASMLFTPGGDGQVSIYRIDGTSAQNPRTATIDSVSGDTITLTTFDAGLFFHDFMDGVSRIRIWNVSKSPEEPAWVVRKPAGNQLQVLDAGDIAGWANGETVQVGDPTDVTPNRCIALDISPMLVSLFGQAFRQTGIMVKANVLAAADGDTIDITPTGVSGSFVVAASAPSSAGVTIIPCTEQSPISNSNLVFLREKVATTAGTRLLSSIAVFA